MACAEVVGPAAENLLLDPEGLGELFLEPVRDLSQRHVEIRELQTVLLGREPRGHEPFRDADGLPEALLRTGDVAEI